MMSAEKKYNRDKRSPIPKNATVSKIMSRIKGTNTKPEVLLRRALFKLGVRGYRVNYNKLPGKPDIAFLKKKVLVFVHGCFWHGCSICGQRIPKHNSEYWSNKIYKNIERDAKRKSELEKKGYRVVEIWEHELKSHFDETIKRIKDIVKN